MIHASLNPSVPVTLDYSWGGFASNTGLLRLENDTLVLECETKDGILEVLRSGVKSFRLSLKEVEGFKWQPGWMGGKIEINMSNMAALEGIAGATQGRVIFKVARKDRDRALGFASSVELALAHRVVRDAEQSGLT